MGKGMVYWVGLILLALAAVVLFGIFCMVGVVMYPANRMEFLKGVVPLMVGAVVFMLIGMSMMIQKVV